MVRRYDDSSIIRLGGAIDSGNLRREFGDCGKAFKNSTYDCILTPGMLKLADRNDPLQGFWSILCCGLHGDDSAILPTAFGDAITS